ncbi:MAG: N-6 DNA methylase, partial [Candidatus Cloacimonetes bacterium]|nr:N-6 DNA methylase [Candidatus Cloacimonadota bacterium]
ADAPGILNRYYHEGKGSDPIVHFYETFLAQYDPKEREQRGVYYTPEPVVRYIVRSIHSLLKSHFNIADGLASEEVTILDPAAGTLTFPAEAINLAIKEHKQKYGDGGVHNLIKRHILPNFYAIELMMAPYTVGHLKISYLLAEHGYELAEDERFQLYLSNTLDPDTPQQKELHFTREISEECALANEIKHQEPILVIMGNPPYSGASANKNDWTEKLLKTDLDGAQNYYTVDGKPLNERNPKWLQDDYVKFLRFAQWKIHKAGKGIVGMITNHSYLENITFPGMRQSLMKTFDEIYVLDLHGNTHNEETAPDGSKDENVFDIKQGTAILLMVKREKSVETEVNTVPEFAQVFHHELYGLRQNKYDWLENTMFNAEIYKKISPKSPSYYFHPYSAENEHYLRWANLPEIFPLNSVGIVTARDSLTIQDTENQMRKTIHHFTSLDPKSARAAYKLGKDTLSWKLELAQKDLRDSGLDDDNIVPILYRPFDIRYTYYTGTSGGFLYAPRKAVMQHLFQKNLAIICNRQTKIKYSHVFVADHIVDFHIIETANANPYIFPLYLYPNELKEDILESEEREYNISSDLLKELSQRWQQFQPEQLFYYVYAVLHSNKYREQFAQYLRKEYPRIPFPEDYELFSQLAEYGSQLAALHLMQSNRLDNPVARYQGSGANDMVDYYRYDEAEDILRINPDKYFE